MPAAPSMTLSDALEPLADGVRPPRRKREELEALAADFVNSTLHRLPRPPRKPVPKAAVAAGGAVLLAMLAWMLWPAGDTLEVTDATAAAADHEAWVRRLEADRERKRQELQRSREYLAKMAAADSALLTDMTTRAPKLAARAEAPVAAGKAAADSGAPSPRTKPPASRPAVAPAQPPASAARATVAGQQAEVPTQVAAAPKCAIHVSDLSSSGRLTYADVARMKGARTDASGHVFTPPVKAEGRDVVFEVMPNGCARVARGTGR